MFGAIHTHSRQLAINSDPEATLRPASTACLPQRTILSTPETIKLLESLATDSMLKNAARLTGNPEHHYMSDMFEMLEFFGISQEKFREIFIHAASRKKDELPCLTAVIGDTYGNVADHLNQSTQTEVSLFAAFAIDMNPKIANDGYGIPLNRSLCADVNAMPEIPDNSFNLVLSQNTMFYTDLDRSLPEIWRILRPKGVAIFDIENWYTRATLAQMEQSGMIPNLHFSMFGANPVQFAKFLNDRHFEFKPKAFDCIACSYFMISKPED